MTFSTSSSFRNGRAFTGDGDDDFFGAKSGDLELSAGDGDNAIEGGGGSDTLTGGEGADIFFQDKRYSASVASVQGGQGNVLLTLTFTAQPDIITDFETEAAAGCPRRSHRIHRLVSSTIRLQRQSKLSLQQLRQRRCGALLRQPATPPATSSPQPTTMPGLTCSPSSPPAPPVTPAISVIRLSSFSAPPIRCSTPTPTSSEHAVSPAKPPNAVGGPGLR